MPRTIREEIRTSSGRARCTQCETLIADGEYYTRVTYAGDGSIYTLTSCEPCNEFYAWLSRDTPPEIGDWVTLDDAIAWAQERGIYSDDEDERAAAVGFLARLGLFSGEEGGDADSDDQA